MAGFSYYELLLISAVSAIKKNKQNKLYYYYKMLY